MWGFTSNRELGTYKCVAGVVCEESASVAVQEQLSNPKAT